MSEEYFKRVLSADSSSLAEILRLRYYFMPDVLWDSIGLPRNPTTKGHWCVDGVCACESEHTAILHTNDDGKLSSVVCATTWEKFERMKASVLKHNPKAHVYWVMGPCKKEGTKEVDDVEEEK